jgi:hypothetical protein
MSHSAALGREEQPVVALFPGLPLAHRGRPTQAGCGVAPARPGLLNAAVPRLAVALGPAFNAASACAGEKLCQPGAASEATSRSRPGPAGRR